MEHAKTAQQVKSFWDQSREMHATVAHVTHIWIFKEVNASNVETKLLLIKEEINALMSVAIVDKFILKEEESMMVITAQLC